MTGPALQPGDERGTRLLTTEQAEHQVLGVGGDPVWQFYDRISQGLSAQFTEASEHARLLARPVSTDASRSVDWFVPEIGARPVVLSEAPAGVAGRLAVILNDIDEFLADLQQRGRSEGLGLREMIREALQVPTRDHVVAIGQRPVLVAWGHILRPPKGRRDIPRDLADWSVLTPIESPPPAPDPPPVTATALPIDAEPAAAPRTRPAPGGAGFVAEVAATTVVHWRRILPLAVVAGLSVAALLAVVGFPGLRSATLDWIGALVGDEPFEATSCWEARDPITVGVDQAAVLVLCLGVENQVEVRIDSGGERLCTIRMTVTAGANVDFAATLPAGQPCGTRLSLPWQSFSCTQSAPDLSCQMTRWDGNSERLRLVGATR